MRLQDGHGVLADHQGTQIIGDLKTAAPLLHSVSLTVRESKILFERVIHNIDLMLKHNCIHGDLSAYNILYWDGEISMIDFPQIVIPESNPSAWKIFQRDVMRVCQYFSSQGVECAPQKLAADLWTAHGHKVFKPVEPGEI